MEELKKIDLKMKIILSNNNYIKINNILLNLK